MTSNTIPPDIYDQEIAYLKEHPDKIMIHWYYGSPLFAFATKSRRSFSQSGKPCGCLTSVHNGAHRAETEELTVAIRADENVPDGPLYDGWPGSLEICAEWQRRIDKELDREPADTKGLF